MSDKSMSDSALTAKASSTGLFSKAINIGLLAMLGGGAAVAAPLTSQSVSRRANKQAVIYVAETSQAASVDVATTNTTKRHAFSSFGKSRKPVSAITVEPDNAALKFLQDNDLLSADKEISAEISGNTLGRKVFAHEAATAHCHLSWGTYYTVSHPGFGEATCTSNYGGTWFEASSKPFINSTTVKNKTPTSFEVDVTASEASTVYAVLLLTSAVAPSSAQVIAGTDGSGNAAIRAANTSVSNTGTLSFTGLDSNATYILYVAARDGTMEVTPIPAQVNPAFEVGLISNVGNWKFPKIRVSNAGEFYLGQSDSGVIRFKKWNGAGFSDYTTITSAALGAHGVGWGNEQRVDFEIDSAGGLHVVFSVYEGQMADTGDPYYGYFNGTSWTFSKIGESGGGVDNVDVFIDSNGKIHTSFMVANGVTQPFYYATNKSGSWAMTLIVNTAGGQDEIIDSYVVANSTSDATVVYRREDNQNNAQDNYYIATSTNAFASPVLLLNGKADLKQYRLAGLHIDASNHLHYAYASTTESISYYVTNASGSWVQMPISKGTHTGINVQDYARVGTTNYFANFGDNKYFMSSYDGSTWVDGFDFTLDGWMNDRFAISTIANRIMYVSENSSNWTIHYHSGVIAGYITPAAPNNVPTDITLTATTVNQSGGANAVVGTLGSVDADSGNTHTYSLVAGTGDTNNASFNISGNSLRVNNASTLAAGTYSVLVRTTDSASGTFDKVFTITIVDDLPATVSGIVIVGSPTAAATSIDFTVTFNEAVSNVTADDFQVTTTGAASATIGAISGSGTTYTVTVNSIAGSSGTVRLDLKANTDIVDAAGNGNNTNGYVAGFSAGSSHTVAVPTAPGAPAITGVTPGDGQVSITFTAPGNNGGSTITGYTVTASPGGATSSGTTSPIVVTGLSNGTSYTFTITATNAVGTSVASVVSGATIPKGEQTITFTNPGAQNFGTTPTLSATSTSSLLPTFTSSTTGVCTVTSAGALAFIAAGTCTINADQAGDSAFNAATTISRSFTVTAVAPDAPVIGTATAGDTQATVSFTTPVNTGGASITSYTITSNPGGITATGAGSPITITGLTNGVAYTFTVTATNLAGTGSASLATNSITPAATQAITFTNPGAQSFGTSPTLSATSDSGLAPTFTSATLGVCTITSDGVLTFVSAGTCSIHAAQAGDSSYLPAAVVTRSFTVNPVAPAEPTQVSATAGDTSATVVFNAPGFTGGVVIDSYTVTTNPGGLTATGSGSPITVTGLTNGLAYTFTVTANNAAGTSAVSQPSNSIIPASAQTITFNNPGSLSFGSTPTLAASSNSGLAPTFTSSTPSVCTVTSGGLLTFIASGTCSVSATQAGNANYLPASPVSQSFTVAAIPPSAPTIGVVTAGAASASVTFVPPVFTGGMPIIGYTVTASPGGAMGTGASSPIIVAGLDNGVAYTFTVTAINSAGASVASAASAPVTPLEAQTIVVANPNPPTQQVGVPLTLSASSSSGLAVVFSSSTPAVCTISDTGVVTFLMAGMCTVHIDQAGSGSVAPAPTVTYSFAVDSAVNTAPEISGTPPLTATVNAPYSFTPTVTDAENNPLTFSATGLPAWLILDPVSGRLSGTPDSSVLNSSATIVLTVSDGTVSISLPAFTLKVTPAVDPAAPVVNAPADITINASALYTPISLRQLMSLATGTSQAAVESAMAQLASDTTAGTSCCTPRPQGVVNGDRILLRPGRHEVTWTATNSAGLTGSDVQVVNVRPLVSFSKNQVTVKGNTAPVRIILNGPSPFYPLQVPYVIDPSTTTAPADHNLVNGTATFNEGQTEVTLNVAFASGGSQGDSQLVVALDDTSPINREPLTGFDAANPDIHDINSGAAHRHSISIVQGNVAPKTSLVLNQGGANTILVAAGGGPVTVNANVVDPNVTDTHSFDWSGRDARLVETDGNATNNTFIFDPSGQSGLRYVKVVTTDSAGASDTADIYFLIVAALPVLEAGVDTDEDGIDDLTEGTADTNGNGIPDYLDNMPSSNVLPQIIINTQSFLIECDPGVRCGVGQFALGGNSGGVQIFEEEISAGGTITADSAFTPVGGIFDFVINDLPTAGQSVSIVIPQQAPIPANAVYRKFQNGAWVNFVENGNNILRSTPGNEGYCPPPGDEEWELGLIEGYLCVQLTIEDGGPNDADRIVNSAVVDPGAVSAAVDEPEPPEPPEPPKPPVDIKTKGSGGSTEGLIIVLLGGLLMLRYARKPAVVLVLALGASATQADTLEKTFVRVDVYQVEGSVEAEDFNKRMARDGFDYNLTKYDVERTGYQVALGYQFNDIAYVELGYLDLGDVRVNLGLGGDENQPAFAESMARYYPRTADGGTFIVGARLLLTERWYLSPEVGVFVWQGDIEVNGAQFTLDYDNNTDLLVGLRLDYQLSKHFGLGGGVKAIRFNDQHVELWGLSGRFSF